MSYCLVNVNTMLMKHGMSGLSPGKLWLQVNQIENYITLRRAEDRDLQVSNVDFSLSTLAPETLSLNLSSATCRYV